MSVKKKKGLICLLILVIVVICTGVIGYRHITLNLIRNAVKEQNYVRLNRLCSMPAKKTDSILLSDFLECFGRVQQYTPLEEACHNNDLISTEILLRCGANPNSSHWFRKREKCLDIAIANSNIPLIKVLIQYGGKTNSGYKALSAALMNWRNAQRVELPTMHSVQNFQKMYKILQENNYLEIKEKNSLLFSAVSTGNIEIANWLVCCCDYSWNCIDDNGESLLHICCETGWYEEDKKMEICEILIKNGISISIKDNSGKTAYDYAIDYHMNELALFLAKYDNDSPR